MAYNHWFVRMDYCRTAANGVITIRRRANKKNDAMMLLFFEKFLSLTLSLSLFLSLFGPLLPRPLHAVRSQTALHTSMCVRHGVM